MQREYGFTVLQVSMEAMVKVARLKYRLQYLL